jgi:hypothetical protein
MTNTTESIDNPSSLQEEALQLIRKWVFGCQWNGFIGVMNQLNEMQFERFDVTPVPFNWRQSSHRMLLGPRQTKNVGPKELIR